jgi:hypothetical protein
MQQYKVIALSVSGRSNKIFKSEDVVKESDFAPGMAEQLVKRGFLRYYFPEVVLPKHEPVIQFPINKPKIKLAIVSAVWKRPEVFELFAKSIHALTVKTSLDIDVIIAGSEGKRSRTMVEKHGFIYVEMPNDPLASKVNATTMIASQLNVDYVLCVGSDDLITPELLNVYEQYMRKGFDYVGVTDFYFYDIDTKQASYWGGYIDNRRNHTAGAGRLLSKRLMQAWNWKPWEIKDSKVLDNSMQNKLKTTPHSSAIFSLKEKGVYALDIKSSVNMTPFNLWPNTKLIDEKELKKHFPYVFK